MPSEQEDQPTLEELENMRFPWGKETLEHFGENFGSSQHSFHKLPLFQRDGLIELLHAHPRRRLQCFTMGNDPEKPDEWRAVCIKGASAEQLYEAAEKGRIWINVSNVDHYDPRYRKLLEGTYRALEKDCPNVRSPQLDYNTLTIASPGTQYYFHISPEKNMMWNMSGDIRVGMLPALDTRFASQELLEELVAREASGSIKYTNEFEQYTTSIDVTGGDCVWWPQLAPIRISYNSLSVSLWSSYQGRRENGFARVMLANRYLLRSLGIKSRSMSNIGFWALVKQGAFAVSNKTIKFQKKYDFTDGYVTDLRLNLDAPDCLERVDKLLVPEFSKFAEDKDFAPTEIATNY
ncbi:MAG: hypothetical protein AB8B86_16495 [Pseudomonadales bacterium]